MSVGRCSRVEHRLVGAEPDSVASTAPPGEWNAIGDGEAPDTLLGPEGSGVQLTSGREARTLIATNRRHSRQAPRPMRARPYVENYTVDASILNLCGSSL